MVAGFYDLKPGGKRTDLGPFYESLKSLREKSFGEGRKVIDRILHRYRRVPLPSLPPKPYLDEDARLLDTQKEIRKLLENPSKVISRRELDRLQKKLMEAKLMEAEAQLHELNREHLLAASTWAKAGDYKKALENFRQSKAFPELNEGKLPKTANKDVRRMYSNMRVQLRRTYYMLSFEADRRRKFLDALDFGLSHLKIAVNAGDVISYKNNFNRLALTAYVGNLVSFAEKTVSPQLIEHVSEIYRLVNHRKHAEHTEANRKGVLSAIGKAQSELEQISRKGKRK